MERVRVWWDSKRGCYVSNAGFILAAQLGIPAPYAARLLDAWFKSQPEHEIWHLVEKTWVS